ncbi:chromosome segregation protein SMC [Pseudoflavonifractor sp. 524-17]|uniref:chromosome segregation protein SMC n=1 Tax=Pseudoflavonifractor sp. 524-17 TaxID=2304577 RepID=UPI00137AE1D0|nr:chromosome segregation protein SMC [Pseudoflavonifractor sp. 524-17]NCE65639.1 chromosome segregation protein SMC [Pseudoflavonifractor sp. 524-17]
MYLRALEIQGFKSFPDKTVLTFGADITAIVGPNGSGKSNLSDAVRWVMGEQSTRTLRGGRMEDVIFGGTERRRQVGFAEVSLVLDNGDHSLDVPEDEVKVTRRYYRSGESEYYINRRSVRLKDVNELFMDTGLGREGYSIIGQGRIDEILSLKSADRREVFEEAAGISRFRHRKEEAERRLERTEENLVRVRDKIEELELQVEPLRQQADKARRFLLLRDELRGLEISLWLEQLDRLRAAAVKTGADWEQTQRQCTEAQQTVEALYARTEALSEQMRRRDTEAERQRTLMSAGQTEASTLERSIAVLKSGIAHNIDSANRIRQELDQQAGRAGALDSQIGERRQRLAAVQAEMQTVKQELEKRQGEAKTLTGQAGRLAEELEELRRRAEAENASAGEAKAALSALSAAVQEQLDRDAALRRALAEGEAALKEAEQERKRTLAERDQAKEARDALTNAVQGCRLRVESKEKKLEQLQTQCQNLQVEEDTLRARIHMLEEMEKDYEGYSKAVKLVMGEVRRERLYGIHGPVAGLIQVPDHCAVAVETALGGAMQHLVTEREEDAKAAMEWLKRREGGRATFLPLTAIRPAPLREEGLSGEPGFVGVGDSVISFPPEYTDIFSYLLGRTVLVEDLDQAVAMAKKYRHRFKIVTLDGQVMNAGGSMTGGSATRSAGILSRANELVRLRGEAQALDRRRAQAEKEREERRRQTAAARCELEHARGELRLQEDAIVKLEERCVNRQTRLAGLEAEHARRQEELEQLNQRSAQSEADTVQVQNRIREREAAAALLRAQAQGKEEDRDALGERVLALQDAIAADRVRLAGLEAECQSAQRSLGELETLRQDLAGDRAQQAALLEEFSQKNQALEGQIEEQTRRLQTVQRENEGCQEAIVRLNQEKLSLEAQRNQAGRESREQNDILLRLERELSALEQKKNAAALEEEALLNRLWESYELTHQGALAQRVALESTAQAQRRAGELKKAISQLGNVNLDAVEEFQRVNERYTYLTGQRDDVEQAKGELNRIIGEITAEMRRIFAGEFERLNQAFGETFQELFGGGRAALELEDAGDILSCGIEIRVQPPGKALKVLSLLSGGEKAFVAIALYFAILKVRPTPFCVMDEIEAALDDANVVRFASYLRGMAKKTQFIVITHRRGTMEEADVLYGVTMQEQGVSRMLTINLNDVERQLDLEIT